MKKNFKEDLTGMSKTRQNEIALQNAIREDGHIYYDEEHPLVINSDCKILEVYEKEKEEMKEAEQAVENYIDEDNENEEISYDEMRNREHDYYDEDGEESTSFDDMQYREVRIVFADKTGVANKVPYSIDIYTSKSLRTIENELLKCNTEEDIEEIQD